MSWFKMVKHWSKMVSQKQHKPVNCMSIWSTWLIWL